MNTPSEIKIGDFVKVITNGREYKVGKTTTQNGEIEYYLISQRGGFVRNIETNRTYFLRHELVHFFEETNCDVEIKANDCVLCQGKKCFVERVRDGVLFYLNDEFGNEVVNKLYQSNVFYKVDLELFNNPPKPKDRSSDLPKNIVRGPQKQESKELIQVSKMHLKIMLLNLTGNEIISFRWHIGDLTQLNSSKNILQVLKNDQNKEYEFIYIYFDGVNQELGKTFRATEDK